MILKYWTTCLFRWQTARKTRLMLIWIAILLPLSADINRLSWISFSMLCRQEMCNNSLAKTFGWANLLRFVLFNCIALARFVRPYLWKQRQQHSSTLIPLWRIEVLGQQVYLISEYLMTKCSFDCSLIEKKSSRLISDVSTVMNTWETSSSVCLP